MRARFEAEEGIPCMQIKKSLQGLIAETCNGGTQAEVHERSVHAHLHVWPGLKRLNPNLIVNCLIVNCLIVNCACGLGLKRTQKSGKVGTEVGKVGTEVGKVWT